MGEWFTMQKGGRYIRTNEIVHQCNKSIIITIDNIRYVNKNASKKEVFTKGTPTLTIPSSSDIKLQTLELFQNQVDFVKSPHFETTKIPKENIWNLIRQKRHLIFRRHVNGLPQTISMAKTPSDFRSILNFNSKLKRLNLSS